MKPYILGFLAIAMQLGGSALLDATSPRECPPGIDIFCSSWGFTGWSMRFISLAIGALATIAYADQENRR